MPSTSLTEYRYFIMATLPGLVLMNLLALILVEALYLMFPLHFPVDCTSSLAAFPPLQNHPCSSISSQNLRKPHVSLSPWMAHYFRIYLYFVFLWHCLLICSHLSGFPWKFWLQWTSLLPSKAASFALLICMDDRWLFMNWTGSRYVHLLIFLRVSSEMLVSPLYMSPVKGDWLPSSLSQLKTEAHFNV